MDALGKLEIASFWILTILLKQEESDCQEWPLEILSSLSQPFQNDRGSRGRHRKIQSSKRVAGFPRAHSTQRGHRGPKILEETDQALPGRSMEWNMLEFSDKLTPQVPALAKSASMTLSIYNPASVSLPSPWIVLSYCFFCFNSKLLKNHLFIWQHQVLACSTPKL